MTWAIAAVAGATVVGSIISSNAAQSAANTQAQAAEAGQAQLQGNEQQVLPYYTPYNNLGLGGVNQLSNMTPYLTNQVSTYQNPSSMPSTYQPFTNADLNANLAPNYAFQLNQGQNATNQLSNATGGINSGNSAVALQNYTQGTAQNAYQNALTNYMGQQAQTYSQNLSNIQQQAAGQNQGFNQYQTQRGNILASLLGITNVGQNAVSGMGNLATGTAQNVAQLGVGAANAQAAGTVGSANAISGGVQSLGNSYLLSQLLGGNRGITPTATPGADAILNS
jgi:hypothetical protein